MSTAGDGHLIDSLSRQMRGATFAMLVQMLGVVGIMIYNAPPFAVIRRPSAELRTAPGSAVDKATDASAADRRPMPQVNLGRLIVLVVLTGVIAAVVLLLSFEIPRLFADSNRRRIAQGTWSIRKGNGDKGVSELFTDEVLKHDTGKLAFGYTLQLGIKMCVTGLSTLIAVFPYLILGGSPFVLGAVVLFITATVLPFPTASHLASWLDRQRELLAQERQDALSTLHDAQLRARQREREKQPVDKKLQQPANRPLTADVSSQVEGEVFSWLTEGAGANDAHRAPDPPGQKTENVGLESQPAGAVQTPNSPCASAEPRSPRRPGSSRCLGDGG
jgi:hypothetical protein